MKGKTVLVTGGTGSIGRELVREVMKAGAEAVRILSNDEDGLFAIGQEWEGSTIPRFFIGDIRDKERLSRAMEDVQIVFHAAALKHVYLCEFNPFEAVKTNIIGTQNVIEVALAANVEKVITISTDKAVNPLNVMGATKMLAERITVSAERWKGLNKTVFASVRFGNVLESRGSVVPIFRKQIAQGGPVTLTDPNMTRFVMSIPKAVSLVLQATEMAQGGEIFILKMPALRIQDLAEVMIDTLAPRYGFDPKTIQVQVIGEREGEKQYEELLTEYEATRATETSEMFVVSPRWQGGAVKPYTSKDVILLNKGEIRRLIE